MNQSFVSLHEHQYITLQKHITFCLTRSWSRFIIKQQRLISTCVTTRRTLYYLLGFEVKYYRCGFISSSFFLPFREDDLSGHIFQWRRRLGYLVTFVILSLYPQSSYHFYSVSSSWGYAKRDRSYYTLVRGIRYTVLSHKDSTSLSHKSGVPYFILKLVILRIFF